MARHSDICGQVDWDAFLAYSSLLMLAPNLVLTPSKLWSQREEPDLSGKEKVLDYIRRRKAITLPTLRRRFHDLPFNAILKELSKSGAIEIQQSGYLGDNLHHQRLIVSAQGMGSGVICAQVRRSTS